MTTNPLDRMSEELARVGFTPLTFDHLAIDESRGDAPGAHVFDRMVASLTPPATPPIDGATP